MRTFLSGALLEALSTQHRAPRAQFGGILPGRGLPPAQPPLPKPPGDSGPWHRVSGEPGLGELPGPLLGENPRPLRGDGAESPENDREQEYVKRVGETETGERPRRQGEMKSEGTQGF